MNCAMEDAAVAWIEFYDPPLHLLREMWVAYTEASYSVTGGVLNASEDDG